MTLSTRVRTELSKHRFNFDNESDLQAGIGAMLTKLDIAHAREVRLGDKARGVIRLDFLCDGGLAIETKVFGNRSRTALIRQLERYSLEESVTGLLVVSNVVFSDMPATLNDKSIDVHFLTGGIF